MRPLHNLLCGLKMRWVFIVCCFSAYSSEIQFYNTKETLGKIVEIISQSQKGAYLRFGDGDVNLAYGESDSYQAARIPLKREMEEAFGLNGPTVLKTLPIYCKEFGSWEEGMFPGNHEGPYDWCLNILNRAKGVWKGEVTKVYSHAALAFAATNDRQTCLDFLMFLRRVPTLFVGNRNVPPSIRTLLFGHSDFIPTPPGNSYNEIDRIEKDCLQYLSEHPGYRVIVTAMGCSGRALQKRLWQKGDDIFLFDFGSLLDAICGWETRAWMELSHFDAVQFRAELENLSK